MAEKMAFEASPEGGGAHSDVKCLRKRGDTSWRPPPGGPQAAGTQAAQQSACCSQYLLQPCPVPAADTFGGQAKSLHATTAVPAGCSQFTAASTVASCQLHSCMSLMPPATSRVSYTTLRMHAVPSTSPSHHSGSSSRGAPGHCPPPPAHPPATSVVSSTSFQNSPLRS
jgi:hypothetical protein